MALTITGIPDCRAALGPSQYMRGYQLQPAASDYVAGGYVINASQVDCEFLYGAWQMGVNTAGQAYRAQFVKPAGSFGTTPQPSTTINMVVGVDAGSGVPLSQGTVATSTNSALTSNVATITAPNTLKAGQFVALEGFSNAAATAFNGQIVEVITASLAQFTFNFTHANIASGADTGTATLVTSPSGPITAGTAVASTNSALTSNVATITIANTFAAGQFVVLQGFTNAGATAFNGVMVQLLTANATTVTFYFNHANIASGADTGTLALVSSPGAGPITATQISTVTNTALTSNVATITAAQNLIAGQIIIMQGLTNAAALNNRPFQIIATGLTNAAFEFDYTTGNIGSAGDAGTLSILTTGTTGEFVEVPAGTDLSACIWNAEFLGY